MKPISSYVSTAQYSAAMSTAAEAEHNRLASALSSGGVSEGYSTANDSKVFIDSEMALNGAKAYQENNNYHSHRLGVKYAKMQQLAITSNSLQKEISQTISSSLLTGNNINQVATNMLQTVEAALNTTFSGEYLFSGTSSAMPVGDLINNLPSPPTGGGPDTSYYLGNLGAIQFHPEDSYVLKDDTNASEACFEKLIRALKLCQNAPAGNAGLARLQQANDLALDATKEIASGASEIGTLMAQIKGSMDSLAAQEVTLAADAQTAGYDSLETVIPNYFQEKANMELSQTVTTQWYKLLQKLIDSVPG